MTSLLLTWTDVWLWIGKVFQWFFQFLPKVGFVLNFIIWIIIAYLFFFWLYKQSKATRKAKEEGRLI